MFSFQANGQIKLIEEYSKKQGILCSNSIYLYTDNLYYYEGGCEERSYFYCGTYTRMNDSTCIFYETKMDDFQYLLNVEFLYESKNTNRFMCFYKSLDDSLVPAELFNHTLEEAIAWKNSDTVQLTQDYNKTFEERDSVLADIPFYKRSRYLNNQKEPNETVVLCLEKFQYLNNKKEIIIVEPNVSQVIIHINLPYELMWKANMYNMKHIKYGEEQNELEPEIVNLNTIFK